MTQTEKNFVENQNESKNSKLNQNAVLPKAKLSEYVVFPFFIVSFLSVLIFFDIVLRIIMKFFPSLKESGAYWFNNCVLYTLKILGTKTKIEGQENLPTKGPAIIISNHQSMFDIPNIHIACAKLLPRFVAKIELKSGTPGVSTCIRLANGALIDRNDPKQAIRELKRFASFLRSTGTSGVIFPEGTRARAQIPKPFKKKGTYTLLKEMAPSWVVPISIQNSWKFQARKFGPIPLGINFKLKIHPPIWIETDDDLKSVIEKIETIIRTDLVGEN